MWDLSFHSIIHERPLSYSFICDSILFNFLLREYFIEGDWVRLYIYHFNFQESDKALLNSPLPLPKCLLWQLITGFIIYLLILFNCRLFIFKIHFKKSINETMKQHQWLKRIEADWRKLYKFVSHSIPLKPININTVNKIRMRRMHL